MQKKPSGILVGVVWGGGMLLAQSGWATLGYDPAQTNPALQQERLNNQIRSQKEMLRQPGLAVPALTGEGLSTAPLPDGDAEFTLQEIRFNASVFLDKAVVEALCADFIGRPLHFADLKRLLGKINQLYQQKGQLASQAMIPPQAIKDGVLRLVLVEARVERVEVGDGAHRVRNSFYLDRLGTAPEQVLDTQALMSAIERFNASSPGPQMTVNLAPGQTFGTSVVDVRVFEPAPWQGSVYLNNYGSPSSGRNQLGATLSWFSPGGVSDLASLYLVKTAGSEYASVRYSRPLNVRNGTMYVEAGQNRMRVNDGPLAALGISGSSSTFTAGFDQPWWLSSVWQLTPGIQFNHQASRNDIQGVPLSDSKVDQASLHVQVEYRKGRTSMMLDQRISSAQVSNGLTGLSERYWVWSGRGAVSTSLRETLDFSTSLLWQKVGTPARLPGILNFQLGGMGSVRGYDSGAVSSPEGVTVQTQLNWRLNDRYHPFLFADAGRTWHLGVQEQTLKSAGLGLNVDWNRHLAVNVLASHAFAQVTPDQGRQQLLAQIVWH